MSRTTRSAKVALVAGYLALAAAALVARGSPATGYELSLYAATPTAVWVGLAVAGVVGGVVSLTAPRPGRAHDASLVLVGASALVAFAVPLIRGYEFYGGGDALTHLGWTREIAAGTLAPTDLLYPALHTTTVFVSETAGIPLRHANLYLVLLAFPLVFLLFVPLTVQLLGGGRRALAVGLLAAAAFVPINNISVHPVAHPASQGILFFAFVLYLFFSYIVAPSAGSGSNERGSDPLRMDGGFRRVRVTGLGVLLALTSAAIVLLHPQQALNVAFAFVAVAVLQAAYRNWRASDAAIGHRPVYAQTAVLVVLFATWAPRFERVSGTVRTTVGNLLAGSTSAGAVVARKSTSLTTVGGSIPELFVKLFLPATVFSLLAAGFVAAVVLGGDRDDDERTLVTYLAATLVPLFAVFLVTLVASLGDFYFRYQGFIMVPVTVLAAAGVARLVTRLDATSDRRAWTAATAVLFLVLVPAGTAALHPSPYMYQPNSQVTTTELSGYESAFEYREPDVPFVGVRTGPERFVHYHYGTEYATGTLDFPGSGAGVGEGVFASANYTETFEVPRYFAVPDSTRQVEVRLYDGFRYPESGFEALDATPGVNRVRSSDDFTLYRVAGDGE